MQKIAALIYLTERALDTASNSDELLIAHESAAAVFDGVCEDRARAARSAAHTLRDAQKRQLVFRDVLRTGKLEAAR